MKTYAFLLATLLSVGVFAQQAPVKTLLHCERGDISGPFQQITVYENTDGGDLAFSATACTRSQGVCQYEVGGAYFNSGGIAAIGGSFALEGVRIVQICGQMIEFSDDSAGQFLEFFHEECQRPKE